MQQSTQSTNSTNNTPLPTIYHTSRPERHPVLDRPRPSDDLLIELDRLEGIIRYLYKVRNGSEYKLRLASIDSQLASLREAKARLEHDHATAPQQIEQLEAQKASTSAQYHAAIETEHQADLERKNGLNQARTPKPTKTKTKTPTPTLDPMVFQMLADAGIVVPDAVLDLYK